MNIRSGLTLLMLTLAFLARPAELKQETVKAWREYIGSATARMQEHLRPANHFLTIEQEEDSLTRARSGEILVSPGASEGLKKIPSGLIHDWLGAVFIEHATLNDVLFVVRDYDRYKAFYPPGVVDSKALARSAREDRFSLMLMNKSIFLKTALDSDYKCSYVCISDRRCYSISESTRIQEIEHYGAPGQRALRENEGNGFIWRIFIITRFAERDGGVYIELETIALSRDIPISLRWIVEPIVRRISTTSLTTSLRQTEDVVRAGMTVAGSNITTGPCSIVPSNSHQLTTSRLLSGCGSARNVQYLQGYAPWFQVRDSTRK